MDCDLVGDLAGGVAVTGGLPESVQSAVACAYADCIGVGGALDPNGDPRKFDYMPPVYGNAGAGGLTAACAFSVYGYYGPQFSGAVAACGRGTICHVVVAPGQVAAIVGANPRSQPGLPFIPDAPGLPLAQMSSSVVYSRSYGVFLACEWGQTLANEDTLGAWAFLNGSAFIALSAGNLKRGISLGSAAILYDFSKGFAIRAACTPATYGY